MTTIKSYTDIEQSRKLAEILPLESADMCLTFVNNRWNPVWDKADDIYQLQKDCYEPDYTKDEYVDFDEFEPKVVSCWSLAALLDVLPDDCGIDKEDGKYVASYIIPDECNEFRFYRGAYIKDNPIDACYEMIMYLYESNLL